MRKRSLLVYPVHCRRTDRRSHQGCSLAGYNSARKHLGLKKTSYKKALEELMDKGLVAERPEVNTMHFKNTAIEVLAFPNFNSKTNTFTPSNRKGHSHRTYAIGIDRYIDIPWKTVTDGYLKDISVQGIFGLLWLCDKTDLINFRGVDYNLIYKYDSSLKKGYSNYTKFGGGFLPEIFEKQCVEATTPDKWNFQDIDFQGDMALAMEELMEKNHYELVPILLHIDPEDPEITRIENEVFKGIVPLGKESEDRYFFLEHEKDIKVIWILRPKLMVNNKAYDIYEDIHQKIYNLSKYLYRSTDLNTATEIKSDIVMEEEFFDYLEEWKPEEFEKVEQYAVDPTEEDIKKVVEILPTYV